LISERIYSSSHRRLKKSPEREQPLSSSPIRASVGEFFHVKLICLSHHGSELLQRDAHQFGMGRGNFLMDGFISFEDVSSTDRSAALRSFRITKTVRSLSVLAILMSSIRPRKNLFTVSRLAVRKDLGQAAGLNHRDGEVSACLAQSSKDRGDQKFAA